MTILSEKCLVVLPIDKIFKDQIVSFIVLNGQTKVNCGVKLAWKFQDFEVIH